MLSSVGWNPINASQAALLASYICCISVATVSMIPPWGNSSSHAFLTSGIALKQCAARAAEFHVPFTTTAAAAAIFAAPAARSSEAAAPSSGVQLLEAPLVGCSLTSTASPPPSYLKRSLVRGLLTAPPSRQCCSSLTSSRCRHSRLVGLR
ncbi:hypothetical protein Scep_023437 [Stephania cephalantha]|uniref:Uncharacterized protein n=1 Tax=Stephania cephalantha TaxID=152367 RepID=A0AAP0F033_9MAGN